MKEQKNSPEKELNEMEASNLSDTQFNVMVIRMLNSMKKDIGSMKNNQAEMKNNIFEMKNTLERISKMDEAEDQISELEHKVEKNHPNKAPKEKRIKKQKDRLRDL